MRRLINTYSIVILAWCLAFECSCVGLKKTRHTTKVTSPGESTEERRFDSLDLTQDQEIIPLKYPVSGNIQGKQDTVESEPALSETATGQNVELPGAVDTLNSQAFRIQIFTSKLYGEARRAMTVAEEIFDRPIFLDYEVPYFKVRAGNFARREDAEDYLQKVKAAGYPNAWVVMVNVNVKELPPLYPEGTPQLLEDSTDYQGNKGPDD